MEKESMLYAGKAKAVYTTADPAMYVISYRDDLTALNGGKKGSFQDKGAINNEISSIIFEKLQTMGIPTHFVKQLNQRECLVHKVQIVPLEVIVRNVAAGSFSKRFGVAQGQSLCNPILEFSYKNDDLGDPMINNDQILAMDLAAAEDLETIHQLAFAINYMLIKLFADVSLRLIDFKLEFGKDTAGNILLADEISPDTCRLWDIKTNESLDKDLFRTGAGGYEAAYHEIARRLRK